MRIIFLLTFILSLPLVSRAQETIKLKGLDQFLANLKSQCASQPKTIDASGPTKLFVGLAGDRFGILGGINKEMCLYKLSDDGSTWNKIDNEIDLKEYFIAGKQSAEEDKLGKDMPTIQSQRAFAGETVWITVPAPSKPNIIYAGVRSGSLYKSLDSGNNWSRVEINTENLLVQNLSFMRIWVNPIDPENIFASGALLRSQHVGFQFHPDTILESRDGGVNWRARFIDNFPLVDLKFDASGKVMLALALEVISTPSRTGHMFSTKLRHHLYRSRDSGSNWERLDKCPPTQEEKVAIGWSNWGESTGKSSLEISKVNNQAMYAVCNSKSYSSFDGGESWSEMLPNEKFAPSFLTLAGNTLYAWYDTFVYRSVDSGKTFEKLPMPMHVILAESAPYDENLLFAVRITDTLRPKLLFKSLDGAKTWSQFGSLNQAIISLSFLPDHQKLLVGTDSGLTILPAN